MRKGKEREKHAKSEYVTSRNVTTLCANDLCVCEGHFVRSMTVFSIKFQHLSTRIPMQCAAKKLWPFHWHSYNSCVNLCVCVCVFEFVVQTTSRYSIKWRNYQHYSKFPTNLSLPHNELSSFQPERWTSEQAIKGKKGRERAGQRMGKCTSRLSIDCITAATAAIAYDHVYK